MSRLHPQDLRALVGAILGNAEPRRAWVDIVAEGDGLIEEVERTAKPEPDPELTTWKAMAKAEGAREERERIIGLLVASDNICLKAKPANHTPGEQWDLLNTWEEVRAALEPKP